MILEGDLEAYFDGELDPQQRAQMEAKLAQFPQEEQRLKVLQTVQDRLRVLPRKAPVGLEQRLRQRMDQESQGRPRPRMWLRVLTWAAAVAVFFCLWQMYSYQRPVAEELSLMVADHLEPMPDDGTFATPDPERLEQWLEPRVAFKPRLPRWPWASPVSGRLCFLRRHKVARIRYRYHDQEFSLFVFPESTTSGTSVKDFDGYRTIHWSKDGQGYVMVISSAAGAVVPLQNLES